MKNTLNENIYTMISLHFMPTDRTEVLLIEPLYNALFMVFVEARQRRNILIFLKLIHTDHALEICLIFLLLMIILLEFYIRQLSQHLFIDRLNVLFLLKICLKHLQSHYCYYKKVEKFVVIHSCDINSINDLRHLSSSAVNMRHVMTLEF